MEPLEPKRKPLNYCNLRGFSLPQRLSIGDKVAALSLSWGGAGDLPHRYLVGKRQLESALGIQVVEMPNTLKPASFIAANPQARVDDLHQALIDPEIKGIIACIGGSDAVRLLPLIDLEIIRTNPKVFLGYSDTGMIHLCFYKAKVVSFYGPSIMSGFGENCGIFPYLLDSVHRTIFLDQAPGRIAPNISGWTAEMLPWEIGNNQNRPRALNPSTGWKWLQGNSCVQGHLLGGCADGLELAKGTLWWPSLEEWKGAILFLENSEEGASPERLKRWLRNYAAQGILEKIAGVLFARPGGPISISMFPEYDRVLLEIIRDECGLINMPIISQMDFGHTDPFFTIPFGTQARIDCDTQSLSIVERAVW